MGTKKLSLDDYRKLRRLVYRGANTLIFTQWRCAFENGGPEDILSILNCYQNEDGGFGHALEANCWNPNSSPYMTSFAISIIDGLHYTFTNPNHPVLRGILKYLASGAYATETGWLGMADIPGNNEYSHAPWFRYDPSAEPGTTDPKNIVNFILKYGEKDSALYQKALKIEKTIPKNKPIPDLSGYDPTKFICWEPMPTDIVDSPDNPLYFKYKDHIEAELDGIVDRLHTIQELPVPGIDDKADWLDNRQIISCYPSTCGFFIMQIELLRKFNRLDFSLPLINIEIKKLTPDLAEDYIHFFDVTPHNDEGDRVKCYCVTWRSDDTYVGNDHWYPTEEERRNHAARFVKDGKLNGYLAYRGDEIVGWCNATADCQLGVNYLRSYWPIDEYRAGIKVKSVFCFVIAPEMQRKGIATQLLERVCKDAADEGFDFVEGYVNEIYSSLNFRGPLAMYEKCGFIKHAEREGKVVMRKTLK